MKLGISDKIIDLAIHATNIRSLGARQVVKSLFKELSAFNNEKTIHLFLSDIELIEDIQIPKNITYSVYKRKIFHRLSRFFECIFAKLIFPKAKKTLVLGDIPLRGINNQILYLQQLHMVSPKVNPYVSNSLSFKIQRLLFKTNLKYIKKILVQTEVTKHDLLATYPNLKDRIHVVYNTLPSNIYNTKKHQKKYQKPNKLKLFYPSAGYSHKNHKLIKLMHACNSEYSSYIDKLYVTLNKNEYKKYGLKEIPWVRTLGRISPKKCSEFYDEIDAIFYPSFLESIGLPLIEAMALNIPVLCADLPYAKWLCEEEAILFNPLNPYSAWESINELEKRLTNAWQVNWIKALSKLPNSWDITLKSIINHIEPCQN